MHIAILMTNTDESDFAQRHPKDGEKFSALLGEVRPVWQFDVFSVKDDEFPEGDLNLFDGFLITGSPASVRDNEPWIGRLEDLLRELHQRRAPMFGACFGHQVLATALGGVVDDNPGGWVLGTVQTVLTDGEKGKLNLYAAHKEQVTQLPPNALITATTEGCPIAGFKIGNHIATTQYHPEMTPKFIAALVDELEDTFDPDVINDARTSLKTEADRLAVANLIAEFFEIAKG